LLPAPISFEQGICGDDELCMAAVMAILAGFPAVTGCWYVAFRSGF
jgi:hypothetical protein